MKQELWTQQEDEIKTIRPRTFTLELSDNDVRRLYEKAATDGTTPAKVLEGFIGDLVDGTFTHGSDEVGLAGEYYDRCCYDLTCRTGGMLEWALAEGRVDDIMSDLRWYRQQSDELDRKWERLDHTSDWEEEGFSLEAACVRRLSDDIEREYYAVYAAGRKNPQAFQSGLLDIERYCHELDAMVSYGSLDAAHEGDIEEE